MASAVVAVVAVMAFARSSHADTVYASSFSTGELIRYDSADPTNTRTVLSSGVLTAPAALAIGPDGNLYIGDSGDTLTIPPTIQRYTVGSGVLTTVHTFSSYNVFPASLVFKGSDLLVGRNPLYVNTGPIVQLANVTGGTVAQSDYTTGGSLVSSPGLALAGDGRLYVADQTYNFGTQIASGQVKRFDSTGTYTGEVIADGAAGLAGPTGLAINGNTLYTASIMNGAILQTDLTTDITTAFGSTGDPFGAGALSLLSDGSLLAGSPSGTGNIYHVGSDGTLLGTFASGLGQVGGITSMAAVPEPGTMLLAASGLATACLLLGRRRGR